MPLLFFIALTVFPILLAGLLILLVVSCLTKSWKLAYYSLFGTAVAFIAVIALFFAFTFFQSVPYDPTSADDLSRAYAVEFEILPSYGLAVLKARQVVVGDSGGQWLLLEASPEQIDKHIAMGFTKSNSTTFDYNARGASTPDWWTPPKQLDFYQNDNWSKTGGWASSRADIGVDRSSGLIWFVASKMN